MSVTRDQVITDLDSYVADQVQAAHDGGVASQQALDAPMLADLNAQVQALTKTDADQDALIAKLQAQLAQYVDIHEITDFASANSGVYLPTASLVGNGPARTTYRMKPGSSTKAGYVSALVKPATNQLKVIRVGQAGLTNPEYGGFAIEGNDQGHAYGGLVVSYATGANVHDLKVTGIPGTDSSPPGETFSLAFLRTVNHRGADIVLDGRNAAGTPVAATLLGYNYISGNSVLDRVVAQYSAVAFGLAIFGVTSGTHTFNDCDFSHNRKAINIEGNGGCAFTFNRPTIRDVRGAGYHAQVGRSSSSVKVTFVDPVVDSWPLKVAIGSGTSNVQSKGDIHLILNGADVSADPSKLQLVGM